MMNASETVGGMPPATADVPWEAIKARMVDLALAGDVSAVGWLERHFKPPWHAGPSLAEIVADVDAACRGVAQAERPSTAAGSTRTVRRKKGRP